MFRSFFQPIFHFSFNNARVDPVASGLDSFAAHFIQQCFAPSRKRLRSLAVAFRQSADPNPARLADRKCATSLLHHCHSLLARVLFANPNLAKGCNLRLFQRYWH